MRLARRTRVLTTTNLRMCEYYFFGLLGFCLLLHGDLGPLTPALG